MVDTIIIAGLVMSITEIIKERIPKKLIFVPVLTLSAVFFALNAYFFGGAVTWEALKPELIEGIKFGATTSGIYGLGKAALGLDTKE